MGLEILGFCVTRDYKALQYVYLLEFTNDTVYFTYSNYSKYSPPAWIQMSHWHPDMLPNSWQSSYFLTAFLNFYIINRSWTSNRLQVPPGRSPVDWHLVSAEAKLVQSTARVAYIKVCTYTTTEMWRSTIIHVQGKPLLVRNLTFCVRIFISPYDLVAEILYSISGEHDSFAMGTKLGKFESVPHCCANYWQNVIHARKSWDEKACTRWRWYGNNYCFLALFRQSCQKRSSAVLIIFCW